MSKRKRLERIAEAVAERVAELKSELDKAPAEPERRRQRRALQAAAERARRVERAQQKLAELVQEQTVRAKTHAKEEAEKGEPTVSVSDPEVRLMRRADGAVAPAWNVQSLPRRRPGWRLPVALSWRSIQPIDARTADRRRDWSRK
jgi:sensor c-di-GMP phosphodiesterase-like protein